MRFPEEPVDASGRSVNRELYEEEMSTAIGDGIALACERLKSAPDKSKVVILLTDGANETGIDPAEAAKAARALGIRIHTIGVGTNDPVPFPVKDRFGDTRLISRVFRMDEKLLKEIAETTGGRFFKASDTESLERVYQDIDRLEKTKSEGSSTPTTASSTATSSSRRSGCSCSSSCSRPRGCGRCHERARLRPSRLAAAALARAADRRGAVVRGAATARGGARLRRGADGRAAAAARAPGRVVGRSACALLAFAALVVAAAGPRFGVFYEPVVERGADLVVLLDVSKSMLSEDVAPNRLERAKSDVRDLVSRVVGHRLGLVAFAGKAVVACPLTTDRAFFKSVLDPLGPRSAPRGGTAIGDALRVGLAALPPQHDRDQALLLITDGEDQDSYPLEAAAVAAERGVKIFTVGLGDPTEGSRVPVESEQGARTFLKHDGQEVWSKMQESLLTELATKTGGAYVPARTRAYDLGEIYEKHLADLATGEIREEKRKRLFPQFQLFLALGLGFALLELLIAPPKRRALATAVALLLVAGAAPDARAGDASSDVKAGLALLDRAGRGALARLDAAAATAPGDRASSTTAPS